MRKVLKLVILKLLFVIYSTFSFDQIDRYFFQILIEYLCNLNSELLCSEFIEIHQCTGHGTLFVFFKEKMITFVQTRFDFLRYNF